MTEILAVETHELHKSFGSVAALRGVNLSVRGGEIVGLLGPNGAGKSTTINVLSCLLRPDRGEACVLGRSVVADPMAVKRHIGVVPQEIALYPDLSASENLAFWGKMYGLRGRELQQRIDEVLEVIGLTERRKGQVATFSGGMKRRVNIGIALLHRPRVLILDEPTVGIDPQSRRHILDNVKLLNEQGVTVLYSTHYMEEAEELCDRIAIIDQGQVIASGTNQELVHLVGGLDRVTLGIGGESAQVIDAWRAVEGVKGISAKDGHLTLLVEDGNSVVPKLFEPATRAGVRILSVEVREPNLEAVFMHLTGRALRD